MLPRFRKGREDSNRMVEGLNQHVSGQQDECALVQKVVVVLMGDRLPHLDAPVIGRVAKALKKTKRLFTISGVCV